MSNFIYVLRKRWKRMKGNAPIRTWLTFHVFVGLMSPIVIAFHAAFQSKNLLATGTWAALAIVVGTGVFGRFLFALVPAAEGKMLALGELKGDLERARGTVTPLINEATNPQAIVELLNDATSEPPKLTLLGALVWLQRRRYALARLSNRTRSFFPSDEEHEAFREQLSQLVRLRLQVALYDRTKRLFRVWLAFHIALSVFMVFLIAAHVAISLYLGYGWIFSPDA
jgi:hypothetical protein